MALTSYQDFQYPNFNLPGFPYANLPQQIAGSMAPPPSGLYGRFRQPQAPVAPPMPQGWAQQLIGALGSAAAASTPKAANASSPPTPTGDTFAYQPLPTLAPGAALGAGQAQVPLSPGQGTTIPFTVPTGANGTSGSFAFAPNQSDSTQGNRAMVIRDANGNVIGTPGGAGQNGIQYFSVGGPALDRWGRPQQGMANLMPGQTYYASISGSAPNATPGAASLDVQANYGGTSNMQDFLRRAAMSDASSFGLSPQQRAARANAMVGLPGLFGG